jgi:hypothetical protein
MMIRILTMAGLGAAGLLLAADDPKEYVEASHTEHADFPSGGTLRLPGSHGILTIEGWDRPDVEIVTVRTTYASERDKAKKDVESHHATAERKGDELVITMNSPWYSDSEYRVEYRIRAPRTAKLVITRHFGEVNVDGLVSDIEATLARGQIVLHLPEDGQYSINAKCDIGNVNSDYEGQEKRLGGWWFFGHRVESGNSSAPHKLNLRVGYGDIVILKTRIPKAPEPKVTGL